MIANCTINKTVKVYSLHVTGTIYRRIYESHANKCLFKLLTQERNVANVRKRNYTL